MIDDKSEGIAEKFECLHKRSGRCIVVDRIHLNDLGIRVFFHVVLVVLVEAPAEILSVFSYLVLVLIFFLIFLDTCLLRSIGPRSMPAFLKVRSSM